MNHRISAGALVEHEGRLLLVRHRKEGAYDFWVAPGGGIQGSESLVVAAEREVKEETGLVVRAERVLYVEEFHNPETRHCKFWLQATLVGGSISVEAPEATAEYIVAAAWHTEDQVRSLQVFPEILQARYWQDRKAGFSSGFSIWACAAWSSGSRRCAVWPNPSLNPRPATAGAVSRASASRTIVAYRAYSTRLRGRG